MTPEEQAERLLEALPPEVLRALRRQVLARAVVALADLAEEAGPEDERALRHRPLQARPGAPRQRKILAQGEEGGSPRPSTRAICEQPSARPQDSDRKSALRELKGSGLLPEPPQDGRRKR